jgi:hypothetical protein
MSVDGNMIGSFVVGMMVVDPSLRTYKGCSVWASISTPVWPKCPPGHSNGNTNIMSAVDYIFIVDAARGSLHMERYAFAVTTQKCQI